MPNAKMWFVRPRRQGHVHGVLCIGYLKKLIDVGLHWLSGARNTFSNIKSKLQVKQSALEELSAMNDPNWCLK